ncbi:hypothetical protein [Halomonas alkalicola]|uniref:hypothetical protein n=1 Tax=Halomonas alkalicola TaxID=1930622 RepID=UPI00265D9835|nr:hypothetical protein [Halomonas alkalicola]
MGRLPRVVAAPAVQPCAAADQGGDPRAGCPAGGGPAARVVAVVMVMAVPAVQPCHAGAAGGSLPALLPLARVVIPGRGALPAVPGWRRVCW